MVPSLRFLPRWWLILSVLLAVALSLGAIAWLAMIARRGRPLPPPPPPRAAPAAPPPITVSFPEDGCPAVGESLLALHHKVRRRPRVGAKAKADHHRTVWRGTSDLTALLSSLLFPSFLFVRRA